MDNGIDARELAVRASEQAIDEALREGAITGRYTIDGRHFLTDTVLRRIIRDELGRN